MFPPGDDDIGLDGLGAVGRLAFEHPDVPGLVECGSFQVSVEQSVLVDAVLAGDMVEVRADLGPRPKYSFHW